MNNTDEIIKKYFEKHPDVKVLAEKYGLKNEFIVVDPFDEERFVLNPECFDKYLKAYEFSFCPRLEFLRNIIPTLFHEVLVQTINIFWRI